jgi:hypothetical protein
LTAAEVLIAWSHAGRLRSEAAFAALAGVAPIPASPGQVVRHRLHPVQELAGGVGFLEPCDQVGQGAVIDAAAVLGGGDREADGQVRLAHARRNHL